MQEQAELFGEAPDLPAGFRYQANLVDEAEEQRLIRHSAAQDLAPFEFHGFFGKRRVVFFGWRYDFNGKGLQQGGDIPAFLIPIRECAARSFGLDPLKFE